MINIDATRILKARSTFTHINIVGGGNAAIGIRYYGQFTGAVFGFKKAKRGTDLFFIF